MTAAIEVPERFNAAAHFLDRHVAIDERQAESPGQPPADGRLARAHQADQHDRPI